MLTTRRLSSVKVSNRDLLIRQEYAYYPRKMMAVKIADYEDKVVGENGMNELNYHKRAKKSE